MQIGKRKDIKFFFGAQGQSTSTSTDTAAATDNSNDNPAQSPSVSQGPHLVHEGQEEEDGRQSLQAILDNLDEIEHGWDQSFETSEYPRCYKMKMEVADLKPRLNCCVPPSHRRQSHVEQRKDASAAKGSGYRAPERASYS